jgi:hypothetical protein
MADELHSRIDEIIRLARKYGAKKSESSARSHGARTQRVGPLECNESGRFFARIV